jgi:hypothetical protein
MSLVLRHNITPNKLVLSSPTEKSHVEKSLSSVIDTFDPEARKRLVSSLRRRELEHKKDIERIKEEAQYEVDEALREMKEELMQSEQCHEVLVETLHVLFVFFVCLFFVVIRSSILTCNHNNNKTENLGAVFKIQREYYG